MPMSTSKLDTAKTDNEQKEGTGKNKSKPKSLGILKMVAFLAISMAVVTYAGFYFMNYQPTPIAEKFYADRKGVADYQKYKDSESAKKKAEKNVYLQ